MRLTPLALLAVLSSACAGPLSESESLFDKGHYAEAKQRLAALDRPGRRWRPEERARFALYEGLVQGALGDRARATQWLREARRLELSLDRDDTLRLEAALDTYDAR